MGQWKAKSLKTYGAIQLLCDLDQNLHVGTWINHPHYGNVWQLNTGQFMHDNQIAFYNEITIPPVVEVIEHIMYSGEENA